MALSHTTTRERPKSPVENFRSHHDVRSSLGLSALDDRFRLDTFYTIAIFTAQKAVNDPPVVTGIRN